MGRNRRGGRQRPWRPCVLSPEGENKPAVTPDRRWRHGAKPKGARQRPWRPCVLSPEGENKPAVTPDRLSAVWGEGSFRGFGRLCTARGAPMPTRKAPRNPKNSGALCPFSELSRPEHRAPVLAVERLAAVSAAKGFHREPHLVQPSAGFLQGGKVAGFLRADRERRPGCGRDLPAPAARDRPAAVAHRAVDDDIPAEGPPIVRAFEVDPLAVRRRPLGDVERTVEVQKQAPAPPQRGVRARAGSSARAWSRGRSQGSPAGSRRESRRRIPRPTPAR